MMKPTRRGFLKMLGAAAALPAVFPMKLALPPASPLPALVLPGQLASQVVPDGKCIVIRALDTNKGSVYLGDSMGRAKNRREAFVLEPGCSLTLGIDNVNRIFMDTEKKGDTIHIREDAV